MKAQIKYLHSPDVDDLQSFIPQVKDSFCFLLQIMVGPLGQQGEESFDALVCTPKWLIEHFDKGQIIIGRHYLLVFEYDYDRLTSFIDSYIEKCEGESWQEIATKLSRIGKWEFEDYRA